MSTLELAAEAPELPRAVWIVFFACLGFLALVILAFAPEMIRDHRRSVAERKASDRRRVAEDKAIEGGHCPSCAGRLQTTGLHVTGALDVAGVLSCEACGWRRATDAPRCPQCSGRLFATTEETEGWESATGNLPVMFQTPTGIRCSSCSYSKEVSG